MKLSKEDLKRLVWHSQAGLTDCDSLAWLEFIDGILNGRYDEPLEIEGYERSGWTKFDKDNPKTFPPAGKHLLLAQWNNIIGVHKPLAESHVKSPYFVDAFRWRGRPITHWKAIHSPVEKEEGK